jgi:hypothetical protein
MLMLLLLTTFTLSRYIVRGIFFKLAFDFKLGNVWMYGGEKRSDEFAVKASGHGNHVYPRNLGVQLIDDPQSSSR